MSFKKLQMLHFLIRKKTKLIFISYLVNFKREGGGRAIEIIRCLTNILWSLINANLEIRSDNRIRRWCNIVGWCLKNIILVKIVSMNFKNQVSYRTYFRFGQLEGRALRLEQDPGPSSMCIVQKWIGEGATIVLWEINLFSYEKNVCKFGSVLVYDFWTPPLSLINFVHDHFFQSSAN